MLFLTKGKKFGMILIMSIIMGMMMALTGMGLYALPVAVASVLIAELIWKRANFTRAFADFAGLPVCLPRCSCHALDILETTIPKGRVIAVIGRNRAGRSTLSKCLCGLVKGCGGVCCSGGETNSRRRMQKKSYIVMQDVNHQRFCESVEEELRLGMDASWEAGLERVVDALKLMPLRDRHPPSLSGGQEQRAAIVSALLAGKELLVFDEPTSGLDFRRPPACSVL